MRFNKTYTFFYFSVASPKHLLPNLIDNSYNCNADTFILYTKNHFKLNNSSHEPQHPTKSLTILMTTLIIS
jgi:hypothetical protein